MKPLIWAYVIIASVGFRAMAQPSLKFFTNQANAQLQAEFGFGVTNIPVYSASNSAAAYRASVHYVLQAAANAYDATTPATNFPSVFRPLFSWRSNTLFIVGYSCVTTDFYAQISGGFKALTDPTISSNDNVWGIPWVVGAKGQIPAFNEYCYATQAMVSRDLLFVRRIAANGQPDTNQPPLYTNQLFVMSVSNVFGAEAWNSSPSTFTNRMTLVFSNQISITITNNYNFGTNMTINTATNWSLDSWPGWNGYNSPRSFVIPSVTNIIPLPLSYWSESTAQLVSLDETNWFLASDLQQIGWPVHAWTLNITNNLMYALIDSGTGRVLDFVNLGAFGSALDFNQVLNELAGIPDVWTVAPAFDSPNSPKSIGVGFQIDLGITQSPNLFWNSLNGSSPCIQGASFADPYLAIAAFIQSCSWQASDPMVHYTIEDLTNPGFNQAVKSISMQSTAVPITLDNSICSLGEVNPDYNSGAVENESYNLTDNQFQIEFTGATDLPYQIWGSTNLTDWSQIGTAAQPSAGFFQFEEPATTNNSARFYQVRLP